MNIIKNYYRDELLNLIQKTNGKPIMLSGILQYHPNRLKWVTFTDIKPYREDIQTNVICQHLNFKLAEVEKWAIISSSNHGKKFYLIGFPAHYRSTGGIRGCLEFYRKGKFPPVFISEDLDKYKDRLKNIVYELIDCDEQKI